MNSREILMLKFYSTGLGEEVTIGYYLNTLLRTLWKEGECFSSKRPLGNSGWQYDIYVALIKHEIVDGVLDKYGYIDNVNFHAADRIISECIEDMAKDYECN